MLSNKLVCILVCLVGSWGSALAEDLPSKAGEIRSRRPVALAISADGSRLFVANARSGSLSIVDLKAGRVVSEQNVGQGLADLALLADGRLLAVDRDGDRLIVLKVGEGGVSVVDRLAVAADPASLLVDPDGSSCVVASTRSRKLSRIFWDADRSRATLKTIDLPFAPLLMAWLVPGSKLVVADAFGGSIGVVELARDAPVSIRSIPAHNIRGLALTPDGRSLVVAHQTLSKLARSTFEDVHWGSLIGNHLRILGMDALGNGDGDILRGSRVVDLGGTGLAAGDPGAVAFDSKGRMIVALSGVHEIGFFEDSRAQEIRRVAVGTRPVAVVPSPDGSVVYVADSLDDAISAVDVTTGSKVRTWSLGPRPQPTPIDRGERLFFDARLSHDGWMSCQSCHTDGRDNGRLADTLTDGGFGAPKRVTSLLGVGLTGPWGWLGSTATLEDQVRKSIETTMRGQAPPSSDVDDLTAYLRSLPPPKPPMTSQGEAVARGREVFKARKCAECHAPPEYTSEGRFDVGLRDEAGNQRFNPPSLRGAADRPPYLHDGRAGRLQDVFIEHRHPRNSAWSAAEVDDLVAFLKSL